MSTDQQLHCRICHGQSAPYDMGDKNGYHLEACRACGSVQVTPWPDDALIESYYGDIQPEVVHAANPEAEITGIAKLLKKRLPADSSGKRLLDVNAQRGYAVMAARQLGFKTAKGLNYHDFYARFAEQKYGAEYFQQMTLADYAATGAQADVILCLNALGEQTDPDAFVAALAKTLAKGGMAYIEEADGNHFNTPRSMGAWAAVEPPATCAVLSKAGTAKLLARHGLVIRKSLFTWAPYMRLIVGHKA